MAINLKDRPLERDSVYLAAVLSFSLVAFINAFGSMAHPVTFHPTAPLIIVAHSPLAIMRVSCCCFYQMFEQMFPNQFRMTH